MKKIIVVLVMLLFFTGCMNSTQLKDKAIIQAVGVDMEDDEFIITVQKFTPEGLKSIDASKPNNIVLQAKGNTISDALNNIKIQQGNQIFLGNNNFIVIGRKTAEKGISPILNFFNADYENTPNVYVVISDTDAKDIIDNKANDGITPSLSLDEMLDNAKINGDIGQTSLIEITKNILSEAKSPYIPIIKTGKDYNDEKTYILKSCGIFDKDKLIDEFTNRYTRGLLFATGKVKQSLTIIKNKEFGKVSVYLSSENSKISINIDNKYPVTNIDVKINGEIREVINSKGRGVDISKIKKMENACEEKVLQQINISAKLSTNQDKVDIFGFSDILRQQHPNYWKSNEDNWKQLLENMKFKVKVKCNIDKVGLDAEHKI